MSLIQTLVLIGLVVVWGWVLGRPLLQNTFNRARRDPVGHFNRNMSVLGQAPRRSLDHSSSMSSRGVQGLGMQGLGMQGNRVRSGGSWATQPARKRRLQVMMGLLLAVMVSALLAVVAQGIFVAQLGVLAAALVLYVGLAAVAGAREAERGDKVRYLNPDRAAEPARVRAVAER